MDYKIGLIDVEKPGVGEEITILVNKTLHRNYKWSTIKYGTLHDNTIVDSPGTFYVGAFNEGQIVGFTAFKSHDFLFNGEVINCYHNCVACTSEEFKGRRIFPNIINFGIERLKEIGAGFLYGIPNQYSKPVLEKLGYNYYGPFLKANVYNIPGVFESAFNNWRANDVLYNPHSYFQNDYQLIDVKTIECGNEVIVFEDLGNLIWGKIKNRPSKLITLSYFSVGGMIINKPHFFKDTIKKLLKKHPVNFVQFIFHNTSVFKSLFRKAEVSAHAEPFMVYDIHVKTSEKDVFNFMPGIKNNF